MKMSYTWNAYTADEPDPWPGMREDAIDSKAESLMGDEGWIEAALADGIDSRALAAALAEAYVPGTTHARVGGLLMDALWDLAVAQATKTVDDGE
jgi:hypothetical protein